MKASMLIAAAMGGTDTVYKPYMDDIKQSPVYAPKKRSNKRNAKCYGLCSGICS